MPLHTFTFTAFGVPQPQGSMRAFMPKGARFPVLTTANPKMKGWRQTVADEASHALLGTALAGTGWMIEGPVGVAATFYLPRPKSLGLHQRPHLTKPDSDKLLRAIFDALTGVVFRDDSQVVRIAASKHYARPGESPRAVIAITDITALRKESA